MVLNRQSIIGLGFFTYLVSTMINLAAAGSASRDLFPDIRLLATAITLFCILLYFTKAKIEKSFFVSVFIIAVLYGLGVLNSLTYAGSVPFIGNAFMSVLLVITGAFYFCHAQTSFDFFIALGFVLLSVFVVAFLYVTQGLLITPFPRFVFERVTSSGSEVLYGQGVSKFFGATAILCFWLIYKIEKRFWYPVLYGFFASFSMLSFIGGARGDFMFFVFTILLMGLSRGWRPKLNLIIFCFLALFLANYLIHTYGDDLVAIRRMQVTLIGGDLGMRDILLGESIQLLAENPRCLILGCGYVFFQNYFDYSYGLYPHNIVVESLITWGICIVLPLSIMFFKGVAKIDRNTPYFWVGVYMTLIGLKSGDVIGSWLALSFVIAVSGIGLSAWVSRNTAGNRERLRIELGRKFL